MRILFLTHLECGRCEHVVDAGELQNTCPRCGGPFLCRYDLEAVSRAVSPGDLSGREGGLWKYREFLPVSRGREVTLGEGGTPITRLERTGKRYGLSQLLMKDEGLNPTGSFKARGAAVGIARARELGARTVTLPTAGNAGGAWAAYAAQAGLKAHIFMPEDAPSMFRTECEIMGAGITLVPGLISDAGKAAEAKARSEGWFVASTLKEPYRIEGKKTMGLEIAESLGWRWPSAIIYPTGGGVGLIAIWKAVLELEEMGWVQGDRPRMVAVQASGCRPVVDAFRQGSADASFFEGARTVAAGMRVPGGIGHFLVLKAIYDSGGTAVDIDDGEIMKVMGEVGASEGQWICPEGAAAVAAVGQLAEDGYLCAEDEILILNTGSGVKYQDVVVDWQRKARKRTIPGRNDN